MRQMIRVLVVLTALTAIPSVAAAQAENRGSASGLIGAGRTWDDESNIGGGVVAGGRVDWRVFGNTRLEISFDVLTHNRTPEPAGAFGAEGTTALIGASLVQRFGSSATQPYILGGFDNVRHSGTTTFDGEERARKSTDWGYHFGGGVAVRVGSRIEVGSEARFYMIQPQDGSAPALAYWIGARVGMSF